MNAKGIRSLVLVICIVFGALADANAQATAYFVATNGNDSNIGTEAQPFRTIRKGVSVLSPGATLYIKSGTYAEALYSPIDTIPNGTSWTEPVTIAAYSGAEVILRPTYANVIALASANRYIILDGLIIDAVNAGEGGVYLGGGTTNIRIQNSEIMNAPKHGIHASGGGFHHFVNLRVHDNGRTSHYTHGMYIESSNNVIENCEVYNNASYGIHVYGSGPPSNNVVRSNRVHHNTRLGSGGGIILAGPDHVAYNNVIWSNDAGYAIDIAYGPPSNTRVHNNTVFNRYGIVVAAGSTNVRVQNNIVYGSNAIIENNGSSTTLSNNLLADPRFVDAGAANFRLQSTSPAIDAGIPISGLSSDFAGAPRPQGSGFDIGAYEYGSSTATGTIVTTAAAPAPTPAPAPAPTETAAPATEPAPAPAPTTAGGDTTLPVVSIRRLTRAGKTDSYTLAVHATDNIGITRMEVFVDGVRRTGLTEPYRATLQIEGSGLHMVQVHAWDAAGNWAKSSRVLTK